MVSEIEAGNFFPAEEVGNEDLAADKNENERECRLQINEAVDHGSERDNRARASQGSQKYWTCR